jgi:MYXO-CTERM domain-containing protein
VVELEQPRLCRVSVNVTFSGDHATGDGGPLAPGLSVAQAKVRAEIAGSIPMPVAAAVTECAGQSCNSQTTDAAGMASFSVPVVGDAPRIEINANLAAEHEGALHYYTGSTTIDGCTRTQDAIAAPVSLDLTHAELNGLQGFIAALGDAPRSGTTDSQFGSGPGGCMCRSAPGSKPHTTLIAALLLGLGWLRRRSSRANSAT